MTLEKGRHPSLCGCRKTHIRFSYADFGLEQAVGAIKMRVQECGGVFAPPTAITRAVLIQEEALYLEARKWLEFFSRDFKL